MILRHVIRRYADGTEHLFLKVEIKDGDRVQIDLIGPCPFWKLLRNRNYDTNIEVQARPFGEWEKIGETQARDLLMKPRRENTIYKSLRRKRGRAYTWEVFCKNRDLELERM